MEVFLFFAGIYAVFWLWDKLASSSSPPTSPTRRPSSSTTTNRTTPRTPPRSPNAYRPTANRRSRSSVRFISPDGQGAGTTTGPTVADLAGLRDAFTGAPLSPALGLYRCETCKVYYHRESYEVIAAENGGRCVACSGQSIRSVSDSSAGGRNYTPDVVTLANFRKHFGHVVTFEGRVVDVRTSRRGSDYAVMFEDKSWRAGFKLVFFRGSVRKVGGARYVQGLRGKSVKVRGLLVDHSQFGPEIIVAEKSMILGVN